MLPYNFMIDDNTRFLHEASQSANIHIKLIDRLWNKHFKINLWENFPCGNEKVLASSRSLFYSFYRWQYSKEAGKVQVTKRKYTKSFPQKVRRPKPQVQATFNFLPDTVSRRQARDATLNVLDLFNGGEKDRSSVNFDQGERRDRTLDYDTYEQRSDESLVDDYLEKNSLVDCSSATIPLLEPKKKKTQKSKKNTSRKERLERSKLS